MYDTNCDYCKREVDETDGNWGWTAYGQVFHTECLQQYEYIDLSPESESMEDRW